MNKTTELTMNAQTPNPTVDETSSKQSQPVQKPLFHDVNSHLKLVTGLHEANMFAASINFLKKSLITLEEHTSKNQDKSLKAANELLVEVHTQLGWSYYMVNEAALSLSHTNKALGLDYKNARSMYLLAKNLLRCKEILQGYDLLKEAKDIAIASMDDEYYGHIDNEMKKYEKRVQRLKEEQVKKQAETTSTSAASSPGNSPVTSLSTIIDKEEAMENRKTVKIEKKNVEKLVKKSEKDVNKGSSFNAGMLYCFAGTVLSSSVGSWLLMKNSGNVSEKTSVIYSLGIGAVVGGVCAFVLGRNKTQQPEKKEKKQDLSGSFFENIANS